MKKKNIFKTLFFVSVLSLGFCSCDSDETYDFTGNSGALYVRSQTSTEVNAPHNAFSGSIKKTPITIVGGAKAQFPIRSTVPSSERVAAKFEIDNSLVEAYNKEHGTEFKTVNPEFLTFTNKELSIAAGEYLSNDSTLVELNMEKAVELEGNSQYLVPIVMSKTAGSLSVSEEWNTVFLKIDVEEDTDNIWDDATVDDIQGELVEDRSGWNIYTTLEDATVSGTPQDAFDPNISKRWSASSSTEELPVIVDMGKVYSVAGIYSNYYNWQSVLKAGQTVWVSTDNENWESLGTLTKSEKTVVFYKAIDARYIKWIAPVESSWGGNTASVNVSEFNVYAK